MDSTKLFVALDIDDKEKAFSIADEVKQEGVGFKVGPRLVNRYGSAFIQDLAKYGPVFVDLKFFDIPNTMLSAMKAVAEAGATYATVHALSGPEALTMMANFEKEVNKERLFKVLSVTILTSFNEKTLPRPLAEDSIATMVDQLASDTIKSGVNGLVCSAMESVKLREQYPDAFIVTPGVRLEQGTNDDQKRVVTPEQAVANGASAIVVGRPILSALDKRTTVSNILSAFE